MFMVLTAHGDDAKRWDAYLDVLPYDLRDVHFTSAWGRAHETAEAVARLAVLEGNGRVVLQPFLLRRIGDTDLQDMTAAGYGGLATSHALPGSEDGAEFEREMRAWRADNRVVSEFYLINPIFAAHQMLLATAGGARLTPIKDVVVLHLGSDDELRKGMRATRRHAHDKAAGLHISEIDAAVFASLYSGAMQRKVASGRWKRDANHFTALLQTGALIVGAAADATSSVLAAGVFTFGKSAAYYAFAATVEEPPTGYADKVIGAAVGEARSRGCDWLHLGGGVTADKDDSLLAYKRSFGGVTRVVYAVRRVADAAAYAGLCGDDPAVMPRDFFPAYRAKEAA